MIWYAVETWDITESDLEILKKTEIIFDGIPKREFDHPTRKWEKIPTCCHHLSHALARVFTDYKVVDGWFGWRWNEHSWLERSLDARHWIKDRRFENIMLLDPYPICWVKPHLIFWFNYWPWKQLYFPLDWKLRNSLASWMLRTKKFKLQVDITHQDILEVLTDL